VARTIRRASEQDGIAPTRATPWLPGIEALRGIAALTVVAHHSWSLSDQPHFRGYQIVEGFGSWGVNLFFLLSGFLLAEYFWRPRSQWTIREYYLRRVFRIAPAYYVNLLVLFLFFADHALLFSRTGFRQVVANVTFTQWLLPGTSSNLNVNGVLWTLTLEVLLYAVMPAIALLIRWRSLVAAALLGGIGVAYRVAVAFDVGHLANRYFHGGGPPAEIQRLFLVRQFPGILPIFVLGAVTRWFQLRWLAKRSDHVWPFSPAVLGALLLPSILLLLGIERASMFHHWIWFVSFDLVVVACMVPAVLYAARPATATVGRSNRLFVWFGERSYGIYLWHFPIILSIYGRGSSLLPPTLTHWGLRLVAIFVASTAFGAASYHMVEHPARAWGRSFAARGSRRRAAPAPRGGLA
jgi:peptidoglycan/LPS O-acetylase OafA/YrhL